MEDLMSRVPHLIEGLKTQPTDTSPLWGGIAYADDDAHCCQREIVLRASVLHDDADNDLLENHPEFQNREEHNLT